MALLWTVALCGLFSLVHSASPECEELVKPLDLTGSTTKLHGKWILVATAGSGQMEKYLEDLTSSWFEISPASEEGKVNLRWGDRVNGKCLPGELDATVSGNKVSMIFEGVLHEGEYLQTCPDCLLFLDTSRKDGVTSRYLFLSKTKAGLTESEWQTIQKQAECLNLTNAFYTYEGTDLCPDEREATQQ